MTKRTWGLAWLLALIVPITSAFGFPGRGGGGRGGGGGRAGGGGGMRAGAGGGAPGGMRGGGGGGFSHSPSFSTPRPTPRPSPAGGGLGGGSRPAARPGSGAQVGAGGNRPAARPGGPQLGAGRPSTLPSGPVAGGRPGGSPGSGPSLGNRPGIDNRPGVGNRPGIDNRPGVGQPGLAGRPDVGNRPGIDNRPGVDRSLGEGGRAIAGSDIGNQSIVRGGTTVNRGDVNVAGIRQGNVAGARVDPGYGVGRPGYNYGRGPYDNYHRGWVNGYWHGYHTNPNWGWGSFAVGAATGVAAWGLGSSLYNWGYMPYSNPYYGTAAPVVVEQPVVVAGVQPAAVPVASYDYSHPIDTQAPAPEPSVADQATATFDSARAAFQSGDYPRALQLTDQALTRLPNDATLHEFRALCLFALQQYERAAAPLYAVLSVGPGWDWTTLSGLYPSVDVYTRQIRALEDFTRANPKSAAGHFVLAYHYLTQNHPDAALGQLKQVVSLTPADTLSAQLIKQLSGGTEQPTEAQPTPPGPAPRATPVDQGALAGSWSASPARDTTINLTIRGDGTFAWKVTSKGKTQEIAGDWSLTNGVLTLAQDGQGGALVGIVNWQQEKRFTFRAIGTGPDDQGLTFTR